MSNAISRVFMNGNSQAVRIPQEFRLDASRVQISRNEHGDLVIHPLPSDRGAALLRALQGFDAALTDEWLEHLVDDRQDRSPAQDREAL